MSEFEPEEEQEYKSKTQLKQEMHDLQALGESLVKMTPNMLSKFPIPDNLLKAIIDAQRIKSNKAHKRQLQYIGRLMRDIDPEPIQKVFDALQYEKKRAADQFKQLEKWRDHLLEEGDNAVQAFITEHPTADRQQLRLLIRQVHKEKQHNKPLASAKKLFKYLREISKSN